MDLHLPSSAPEATRRLAALRAGVARRLEIIDTGLTRSEVDAQIDAERWRAYGPNVLVMHNGPLTSLQQQWVAVINAGPEAALAARTAAALAGLVGWEDSAVHVLVPRGVSPPPLPGLDVVIHESRRFRVERDRSPNREPPRVRVERAVIDAAAWTRHPRAACGVVVAAVQQRLTTAGRLRSALKEAGRVRHVALLRKIISDIEGGARALSEIDFGGFCRRHGFGDPVRQAIRVDPLGRRRYLDATLVRDDGSTLAIEIDGAVHLLVTSYWDDCERANEIVIAGDALLRFPSAALYLAEHTVADQLARALRGPAAFQRRTHLVA